MNTATTTVTIDQGTKTNGALANHVGYASVRAGDNLAGYVRVSINPNQLIARAVELLESDSSIDETIIDKFELIDDNGNQAVYDKDGNWQARDSA